MSLQVMIEKKLGDFFLKADMETASGRIGILGASGCGKSLTLKCIAGIETPDRGRIRLDDRCLYDSEKKINQKPRERRLGYLFQNYALFPAMTVEANVAAGLRGSRREKRERTAQMMGRFRLEGLEKRLPGELSGGQQQRVALARIMAYEPELIMLDEPFSALDVYLKEQLQQEMKEMLREYPGTVVLVSHSRDEIYQFSDYLFVMEQGRVIRSGKTREIFANPGNRIAARLTGCKNISPARKTGEFQLYAPDWNLTLQTERRVSDRVKYVGIRAHDLEPGEQERETNCLPCRIGAVTEAPFETVYLVNCPDREAQVWWKVPKNRLDSEGPAGMPAYLYLPPKRLLLLEE